MQCALNDLTSLCNVILFFSLILIPVIYKLLNYSIVLSTCYRTYKSMSVSYCSNNTVAVEVQRAFLLPSDKPLIIVEIQDGKVSHQLQDHQIKRNMYD